MDDDLANSIGMLNSSLQFATAQLGATDDTDFIKRENQKARDFTVEMWNKANEYNLPVNLLQRWRDAGVDLNPNFLVNDATANMASTASSPGHSAPNMNSKDIAKYANVLDGLQQAQSMQLQREMVQSQIAVNDSVINKNEAEASETSSRVPLNNKQVSYLDELITGQNNQNIWWDLSLPVKTELLNLSMALESNKVSYTLACTKRVLAMTENDNKLTNMRIQVASETMAQNWKRLDLMDKEIQGKLSYWANLGDAAQRNSKANWLNAVTNSNAFQLDKDKFIKFGDEQLGILRANKIKLEKANSWYDIMQELDYDYKRSGERSNNARSRGLENENNLFDIKSFFDIGEDLFNAIF